MARQGSCGAPGAQRRERNIQQVLRRVLAGEPPDGIVRSHYPAGMPPPGTLGNWDALSPEEQEPLELAVAPITHTSLNAHHDDTLELLVAKFLAARQDLVALLHRFTEEQLATVMPMVTGERAVGDVFAGHAGHAPATEHITEIEEGWRQGV